MHPHAMLSEMVSDRRRELIFDAAAFRRAAEGQSRSIRSFAGARRVVGHRLVRIEEAVAGAQVPAASFPVPAGRQS